MYANHEKWKMQILKPFWYYSEDLRLTAAQAYDLPLDYGNTGCLVFKGGIQNEKYFCLKINLPKGNYWILWVGVVASYQKLGIILENEVI